MEQSTPFTRYLGVKEVFARPMTAQAAGEILRRPIDTTNADAEGNGYLVLYKDGYRSWSPKAQFEEAYRQTTGMTFGMAIEAMRKGHKVARKGWNGRGIFIELQVPDEHSKMTHPYIYIDTTGLQTDNPAAPKDRVPWLASQTDMLSDDWAVYVDMKDACLTPVAP